VSESRKVVLVRVAGLLLAPVLIWLAAGRFDALERDFSTTFEASMTGWLAWQVPAMLAGVAFAVGVFAVATFHGVRWWTIALGIVLFLVAMHPIAVHTWTWLPDVARRFYWFDSTAVTFPMAVLSGVALAGAVRT
jgi:hypothetical protein